MVIETMHSRDLSYETVVWAMSFFENLFRDNYPMNHNLFTRIQFWLW